MLARAMLPIGDEDNPNPAFPYVNIALIVACVLVFLYQLASPDFTPDTVVPSTGACRFALVTGVAGGVEGDLGRNSANVVRPNLHPCP